MKTLRLEESTAKKLYKTADADFKVILEESFGKEFFSTKITDRIKTWKDVLMEACLEEEDVIPFSRPKNKKQRAINAFAKIQLISEVLNEGKEMDFTNRNSYKYYPYFERTASGWVVNYSCGSYCYSILGFGLTYSTNELALYAGNQFLEIYKDYLPN